MRRTSLFSCWFGCFLALLLVTTLSAESLVERAGVTGGLIVRIGCRDLNDLTALRPATGSLIVGLVDRRDEAARLREELLRAGLSGEITVWQLDAEHLPLIDGVANALVLGSRIPVPLSEVHRVVVPRGVVLVASDIRWSTDGWGQEAGSFTDSGRTWRKIVAPDAEDCDEWTHFLHGPDNNAVAHDQRVDLPYHIQWVGGPKWARHHNYLASMSALVMSSGRLYSIVDEGPIASLAQPPEWKLVARDANNGIVLWKKDVGPWEGQLRPFRSGPTELPRRLVADGDRVYVTLGYGAPVSVLDGTTGAEQAILRGTENAQEIIVTEDRVFVVMGTIDERAYEEAWRRGLPSPAATNKRIIAFRASTGERLWQKDDAESHELLPTTLCCSSGRVFFQNPSHLVCLDGQTGRVLWRAERPVRRARLGWSTPTVVASEEVVFSADCYPGEKDSETVQWKPTASPKRNEASDGEVLAFSTVDGRLLWRAPASQGYNSPVDVFLADGLVWVGTVSNRNTTDYTEGRDPLTGEVRRRIDTAPAFESAHHHRCYRDKATDRFILAGRTGVEFIDLSGETNALRNCWIRGTCQYGVLPANGLLYCPPHPCACYIQSKLSGFWAVAPLREPDFLARLADGRVWSDPGRVERGPASERSGSTAAGAGDASEDDWPTFRHDPARSGRASTRLGDPLTVAWTTRIGGRLSSPVVASGTLLVSEVDAHAVHALDANTGERRWTYVAGGRIDSPPSVDAGRAFFGCADGCVYCLDVADGSLIWRFRAAPIDRRTVSFGRLESVWPVTGSVLVHDGVVYCTAGRSSYLDGGMVLWRLDSRTGRPLGYRRFEDRDPETGAEPEDRIEDVELPGALPDVLVFDGEFLYLRDKRLTLEGKELPPSVPHLYCSAGLLDDLWWHRTYWQWGERAWGRASGWRIASLYRPSGRILATDETTVFGYGRKEVLSGGTDLTGAHLFRADKQVKELDKTIRNNNKALEQYQRPARITYHWSQPIPVIARALVLTDNGLLVAGPAEGDTEPSFAADTKGRLMRFAAADGSPQGRWSLPAQPVFDGMIAAQGSVYVSGVDGSIICLR